MGLRHPVCITHNFTSTVCTNTNCSRHMFLCEKTKTCAECENTNFKQKHILFAKKIPKFQSFFVFAETPMQIHSFQSIFAVAHNVACNVQTRTHICIDTRHKHTCMYVYQTQPHKDIYIHIYTCICVWHTLSRHAARERGKSYRMAKRHRMPEVAGHFSQKSH